MKLWIAAAVIVAVTVITLCGIALYKPVHPKEAKIVTTPDPALESRVTALEDEVRRLARDRAKECGRVR
jgi:hypothetical protein